MRPKKAGRDPFTADRNDLCDGLNASVVLTLAVAVGIRVKPALVHAFATIQRRARDLWPFWNVTPHNLLRVSRRTQDEIRDRRRRDLRELLESVGEVHRLLEDLNPAAPDQSTVDHVVGLWSHVAANLEARLETQHNTCPPGAGLDLLEKVREVLRSPLSGYVTPVLQQLLYLPLNLHSLDDQGELRGPLSRIVNSMPVGWGQNSNVADALREWCERERLDLKDIKRQFLAFGLLRTLTEGWWTDAPAPVDDVRPPQLWTDPVVEGQPPSIHGPRVTGGEVYAPPNLAGGEVHAKTNASVPGSFAKKQTTPLVDAVVESWISAMRQPADPDGPTVAELWRWLMRLAFRKAEAEFRVCRPRRSREEAVGDEGAVLRQQRRSAVGDEEAWETEESAVDPLSEWLAREITERADRLIGLPAENLVQLAEMSGISLEEAQTLAQLTPSERTVFAMHYRTGLESPEIAAQTGGRASTTVRVHLHNARKKIKATLPERLLTTI